MAASAIAVLLAACPRPAPEEAAPPPPAGWRVGSAEHIGLWYHGLAIVADTTVPPGATLPRYAPGYADSIAALKRRRGIEPTALDRRAADFRTIFRDESYRGIEFVPLYFQSQDALFNGIALWRAAGGNPRRAGSVEEARLIAFLSSVFPRAAQRQAIAEWAEALADESRSFYHAYWEEQAPALAASAAAVQREWGELRPELGNFLEYMRLENGEIFLVPALGIEGRFVSSGLPVPRSAIMTAAPDRAEDAVLAFVHELLYPLVGDAIREYIAPAKIRELGEDALRERAAVRGGALLLDRAAPERAGRYRRLYLRSIGMAAPTEPAALDAAFRDAFPLPPELERGLEEAVDRSLAGI